MCNTYNSFSFISPHTMIISHHFALVKYNF
nr:MAG TPA_asm: hypothetical protein [Caudoviricetes sp.]